MKKDLTALLIIFIILTFLTQADAQKEAEVIKRYDYSSPEASFESLKKAITEKDLEGIVIHDWQLMKGAQGSACYGMSFEDCFAILSSRKMQMLLEEENKEDFLFEQADIIYTDDGYAKITEFDFVKELEKWHDEERNATIILMLLERKRDNIQTNALAINYDGTKEWWISIQRYGE